MTEARERWVEQTILHDPEKKNYGNCMQACVASLLNIPLNDVPHFHHDAGASRNPVGKHPIDDCGIAALARPERDVALAKADEIRIMEGRAAE